MQGTSSIARIPARRGRRVVARTTASSVQVFALDAGDTSVEEVEEEDHETAERGLGEKRCDEEPILSGKNSEKPAEEEQGVYDFLRGEEQERLLGIGDLGGGTSGFGALSEEAKTEVPVISVEDSDMGVSARNTDIAVLGGKNGAADSGVNGEVVWKAPHDRHDTADGEDHSEDEEVSVEFDGVVDCASHSSSGAGCDVALLGKGDDVDENGRIVWEEFSGTSAAPPQQDFSTQQDEVVPKSILKNGGRSSSSKPRIKKEGTAVDDGKLPGEDLLLGIGGIIVEGAEWAGRQVLLSVPVKEEDSDLGTSPVREADYELAARPQNPPKTSFLHDVSDEEKQEREQNRVELAAFSTTTGSSSSGSGTGRAASSNSSSASSAHSSISSSDAARPPKPLEAFLQPPDILIEALTSKAPATRLQRRILAASLCGANSNIKKSTAIVDADGGVVIPAEALEPRQAYYCERCDKVWGAAVGLEQWPSTVGTLWVVFFEELW